VWAAVLAVLVVVGLVVLAVRAGDSSAPQQHETERPARQASDPTTVMVGTDALPFSADSVWNRPIPDDATLAPDSDELVAAFNHQWQTNYGTVGINTNAYSIPVYTVPVDQPTVDVATEDGCTVDSRFEAQMAAVPIPDGARPANGTDHSMAIWQPGTDTAWELWQAERTATGGWTACWGGRIEHVSTSSGVFPWPYGVAASGLSYLGGTIKASELKAGAIKHAISVNVVHTKADTQVPPANRNDGNSDAEDAIPEGTRFRLDPTIDVTKLGLGPSGVVIARALQRYGMIVTDTSGAVVLIAEDGQAYVAAGEANPFEALFAPQDPSQVLSWVPWGRLQVVAPSD
jgi:hypothetical protein